LPQIVALAGFVIFDIPARNYRITSAYDIDRVLIVSNAQHHVSSHKDKQRELLGGDTLALDGITQHLISRETRAMGGSFPRRLIICSTAAT
jgi:hypothetical protein